MLKAEILAKLKHVQMLYVLQQQQLAAVIAERDAMSKRLCDEDLLRTRIKELERDRQKTTRMRDG